MLLNKDSTARCMWKLPQVQELIPGTDGKIRSEITKGSRNDGRAIYLPRVVQNLTAVEVDANEERKKNDQLLVVVPVTPTVELNAGPKGNAVMERRLFEAKMTYDDELLHCFSFIKVYHGSE